jgi:hypothetical protein
MPPGFVTLGQAAARLPLLTVACNRCERAGKLSTARLLVDKIKRRSPAGLADFRLGGRVSAGTKRQTLSTSRTRAKPADAGIAPDRRGKLPPDDCQPDARSVWGSFSGLGADHQPYGLTVRGYPSKLVGSVTFLRQVLSIHWVRK